MTRNQLFNQIFRPIFSLTLVATGISSFTVADSSAAEIENSKGPSSSIDQYISAKQRVACGKIVNRELARAVKEMGFEKGSGPIGGIQMTQSLRYPTGLIVATWSGGPIAEPSNDGYIPGAYVAIVTAFNDQGSCSVVSVKKTNFAEFYSKMDGAPVEMDPAN